MSFPYHDASWVAAAEFLEREVVAGEAILAPDEFWIVVGSVVRAKATWGHPPELSWAVTHKGRLGELAPAWLQTLPTTMRPVFANDVFVIWAQRERTLPEVASSSDDLRSFHEQRALVLEAPSAGPPSEATVLPDPDRITAFATLDDAQLAEAMDAFWAAGGYRYDTLRDKTYYAEIDRHLRAFLTRSSGRILDVCCGHGRIDWQLESGTQVHGIELSRVAVDLARERHVGRSDLSFEVGDVHALPLEAASVDHVLFVDAIEHVRDAGTVLTEIARVLKGGGRLLLTSANPDSLHLRMTRALGYPTFRTNWQHLREYAYEEVVALLMDLGFEIEDRAGIFLYPYWGVPGVDTKARQPTDHDPGIVDMMRELGERAGPEYAYAFTVIARRTGGP